MQIFEHLTPVIYEHCGGHFYRDDLDPCVLNVELQQEYNLACTGNMLALSIYSCFFIIGAALINILKGKYICFFLLI